MGAGWPARRPLIAGFALAFAAFGAALPTDATATTRVVTNCLDSGSGSLRDTIGALTTVSGDEVTFSATLPCSTITLSSGEIQIPQGNLSITGPGADALTIDGASTQRIFRHTGTGTLSISGLTVTHGKYAASSGAATGGCLRSTGNIVLTNSTVSSCVARATGSASAYGGGIFTAGDLSLIHSRLSYNIVSAPSDTQTVFHGASGGAAFVRGDLLVSYSTVNNNSAGTPSLRGSGGGLFTYGSAHIEQSTISKNRADFFGAWAASRLSGSPVVSIVNSTISGNNALDSTGGIFTGVPMTLSNSTVAFNHAAFFAGGMYANGVALTLQSSIVADNIIDSGEDDIAGLFGATVAGNHNLIISSSLTLPTDTITACPKLGGLADNGGATLTHALAHDSPAINHGNGEQFPALDQRGPGFPRPFGAGVDIGAYEWQGTPDDRIFNSGLESTCDR
jgi:hypothetical protein